MGISLLLAAWSIYMIPRINVNSDMTKYLPYESQMKLGLDVLNEEFDPSQLATADVKVMFSGLDSKEEKTIEDQLSKVEDVRDVTYVTSDDSLHTLYNLVVPKSVDQKALGQSIKDSFGQDIIVETSQDGATPPVSVIIIAAAIILLILLIMAQSWLDPIIYLLSIGVAVIINTGTNALLSSVSITTNYIGSILQLVLSLDYAIVLMNRYRQEISSDRTTCESVNIAIKKAYPSILSSALTTIIGLVMLAFMRLRIGLDMGMVLAKGVVWSLICTFTVLPSLIMLTHNLLQKTKKRTFFIPTDRLGRFATGHKIPLTVLTVILFIGSFFLSKRTEIYFSTNGESQIAKVFPKSNPFVIIYDTKDDMNVISLADSIGKSDGVQAIISYPTLLKQQYTAEGMTAFIKKLSIEMADYMPQSDTKIDDMLTPEMMRVVYYLRGGDGDTISVTFPELIWFIKNKCMDNPMFDGMITDEMREQMELLDAILAQPEEEPVQTKPRDNSARRSNTTQEASNQVPEVIEEDEEPVCQDIETQSENTTTSADSISIINFMEKLNEANNNKDTKYLLSIVDTTELKSDKEIKQMASFVGSSNSQTKMVYSFYKGGKTMTPLQYVHFLTDDLFKRKSLANMVSEKQKTTLEQVKTIMDYASQDKKVSADEIASLVSTYGLSGVTSEYVLSIMQNEAMPLEIPVPEDELAEEETSDSTTVTDASTLAVSQMPLESTPTEEDRQAELIDHIIYSGERYTSEAMAGNFHQLGNNIDPVMVNLLYNYYGSVNDYNDSTTMSPEELLNYVSDTLVFDKRFDNFLNDSIRASIADVRKQLGDNIGMLTNDKHSLMVIITNLPDESDQTYTFVEHLASVADSTLEGEHYMIGESVMFDEMKRGFDKEMTIVTILTIIAIFTIVAFSFKSIVVPAILVITVMTAVYVNVIFSGIISGKMLYLAYLIVQSILMGATIDYGILFANYYKENRKKMSQYDASKEAYRGAIGTITTSGLIMVLGAGVMAVLVDDVAISAIVGCLSIGAMVSILLILIVLPGTLVVFDKWVITEVGAEHRKQKEKNKKNNDEITE